VALFLEVGNEGLTKGGFGYRIWLSSFNVFPIKVRINGGYFKVKLNLIEIRSTN